jgi:hypothetical protein
MTWHDLPDGGGILQLEELQRAGVQLELEVVVDPEEGLAWGLWWLGDFELIAVAPIVQA